MFATQSYRHCLETERLIMEDIRDPETTPSQRAQLAKALDTLLERKRIMRMKPKPKDVEVGARKRSSAPSIAPMPTPRAEPGKPAAS